MTRVKDFFFLIKEFWKIKEFVSWLEITSSKWILKCKQGDFQYTSLLFRETFLIPCITDV